MKSNFLINIPLLLILISGALHSETPARESDKNREWWAAAGEYTITLNEELTLKDVFDAGIRPRYVPAMAGERLEFRASKFTLIYPNGGSVSTKPGYGRINVSVDQRVSSIAFYESMMTGLDEGQQRLIEYAKVFSSEKTDEEIKKEVQVVRNQPDHFVVSPTSVGRGKINQYWNGGVTAHRSHNELLPFRFIIRASREWQGRRDDLKYDYDFNSKMAPPEGYEQISMEYVRSPKDYDANGIFKAQMKALSKADEKRNQKRRTERVVSSNDGGVIKKDSNEFSNSKSRASKVSLWLIVAVIIAAFSWIMYLRFKRQ